MHFAVISVFFLLWTVKVVKGKTGPWKNAQVLPPAAYEVASNSCPPGYRLPVSELDIRHTEAAMKGKNLSEVWLPLKRKSFSTWRWIDGSGNVNITPSGYKPELKMCGLLQLRDMRFEDYNCTFKGAGYACEREGSCSSLPGYKSCVEFRGRTFIKGCQCKNWYDARHHCEKQNFKLAVLKEDELKTVLNRQWWQYRGQEKCALLWIGARREDWIMKLTGLKEENISFPPMRWAPEEPMHTGACVVLNKDEKQNRFLWKTAKCSDTRHGVCLLDQEETTLKRTDILRTRSRSTVFSTTNNPVRVEPQAKDPPLNQRSNTWAIIGGVIGILLVGSAAIYVLRRIKKRRNEMSHLGRTPGDGSLRADLEDESFRSLITSPPRPVPVTGHVHTAEADGVTCALIAEHNRLGSKRGSDEDVTLRVLALKSCQWSDVYFNAEELTSGGQGILLRKDLHLVQPSVADQQGLTLTTKLIVEDRSLYVNGSNYKEISLVQLEAGMKRPSGFQVAEYIIINREGKKIQDFRVQIHFSWKRDKEILMPMKYNQVISTTQIKKQQKVRIADPGTRGVIYGSPARSPAGCYQMPPPLPTGGIYEEMSTPNKDIAAETPNRGMSTERNKVDGPDIIRDNKPGPSVPVPESPATISGSARETNTEQRQNIEEDESGPNVFFSKLIDKIRDKDKTSDIPNQSEQEASSGRSLSEKHGSDEDKKCAIQ